MKGFDMTHFRFGRSLTRAEAYAISEALELLGVTHTLVVGCHRKFAPPVNYRVDIYPGLTMEPDELDALRVRVEAAGGRLAYVDGAFSVIPAAVPSPAANEEAK